MAVKKPTAGKTFRAFLKLNLDLGVPVPGTTLEEAIVNARKLGASDIVDLSGLDHNDSDVTIVGIHED